MILSLKKNIQEDIIRLAESGNNDNDGSRTTLEVNGARQVGKTYIIDKFANENFKHVIYINLFELSGEQFMACYRKAQNRCGSI